MDPKAEIREFLSTRRGRITPEQAGLMGLIVSVFMLGLLLERAGLTLYQIGRFEINEHAEAYGSALFNSTKVVQQVAPSGSFATDPPKWVPLANPFLGELKAHLSDKALAALSASVAS